MEGARPESVASAEVIARFIPKQRVLGSGVIFVSRHNDEVRGLTTAALDGHRHRHRRRASTLRTGGGHRCACFRCVEAVRKIEEFSSGEKQ